MTSTSHALAGADTPPTLSISVEDAAAVEYAAVPTLGFRARVAVAEQCSIRSISLNTQVRIAATQRHYDEASQRRLAELFGSPSEWARSLRSLLWTHAVVTVPAFEGETLVDIPVACTYDFDVTATKYLHAVRDGEVPLEFLFSGTMFYTSGGLLQAAHISWETEAEYRLPVSVWHDLMDHYFPHSSWLRLDRNTFDRLHAYKSRHTLTTWEDAVEALLRAGERYESGDGDGR